MPNADRFRVFRLTDMCTLMKRHDRRTLPPRRFAGCLIWDFAGLSDGSRISQRSPTRSRTGRVCTCSFRGWRTGWGRTRSGGCRTMSRDTKWELYRTCLNWKGLEIMPNCFNWKGKRSDKKAEMFIVEFFSLADLRTLTKRHDRITLLALRFAWCVIWDFVGLPDGYKSTFSYRTCVYL